MYVKRSTVLGTYCTPTGEDVTVQFVEFNDGGVSLTCTTYFGDSTSVRSTRLTPEILDGLFEVLFALRIEQPVYVKKIAERLCGET